MSQSPQSLGPNWPLVWAVIAIVATFMFGTVAYVWWVRGTGTTNSDPIATPMNYLEFACRRNERINEHRAAFISTLTADERKLYLAAQLLTDRQVAAFYHSSEEPSALAQGMVLMHAAWRLNKSYVQIGTDKTALLDYIATVRALQPLPGREILKERLNYKGVTAHLDDQQSIDQLNSALRKDGSKLELTLLHREVPMLLLGATRAEDGYGTVVELELARSYSINLEAYGDVRTQTIVARPEFMGTLMDSVTALAFTPDLMGAEQPKLGEAPQVMREALARYGITSFESGLDQAKWDVLLAEYVTLVLWHERGHFALAQACRTPLQQFVKFNPAVAGLIEMGADCAPNGPLQQIAALASTDPTKAERLALLNLATHEQSRITYVLNAGKSGYVDDNDYNNLRDELDTLILFRAWPRPDRFDFLRGVTAHCFTKIVTELSVGIPVMYLKDVGGDFVIGFDHYKTVANAIPATNRGHYASWMRVALPLLWRIEKMQLTPIKAAEKLFSADQNRQDRKVEAQVRIQALIYPELEGADQLPVIGYTDQYGQLANASLNMQIDTLRAATFGQTPLGR